MKKLLYLFSASLLLFTSCSSNDNDSSDTITSIFPKTIKYTYPDSPYWNKTFALVYNGNKIASIDNGAFRTDFTYDGNVIVKQINYDISSGKDVKENEITYTYANNKLATATTLGANSTPQYPAKSKSIYTYNSDGTVTIDRYKDLSVINTTTTVETKTYVAVITLLNGNFVKSITPYGLGSEYEYDSKNNPFKNILGFNLLLDNEREISVNNVTKYTFTSSVYRGTTTIGEPNLVMTTNVNKTDYVYNADDYPTKATTYGSDGTTIFVITEYTY